MKSRSLFLLAVCAAVPAAAQNRIWSIRGPGVADAMGESVAGVGDIDKDGHADFLVGSVQAVQLGRRGYARLYSGRTGRLLWQADGSAVGDSFGVAVCGPGDVDNDGTPDLVVGATPTVATSKPGYVRVFSGRTKALIREHRGDSGGEWFGVSVSAVGDVDRDGHADYVVGAPFDDHAINNAGVVRVFSGKTGSVIHTLNGPVAQEYFGFAVAGAGDVDKDGRPDIVVGAYQSDVAAKGAGRVFVFSGSTGRPIRTLLGIGIGDGFGFSVAGAGDVDRDGHDDVLVGALWDDPTASDVGSVWLYSGKSGQLLKRLAGDVAFDGMGSSVCGAGDVDGDGVPDIAGGAIQGFPPGRAGYVRVWSGKTFQTLYTLRGGAAGDWFGRSIANAGDVNKDGNPDLVVGAANSSIPVPRGGSVWVFSGNHEGIVTNRETISATTGGIQILSLDARPAHAGKLYLVLGTAGSTAPGIAIDPVTLPLTLDSYFDITLLAPNTPLLRLTLGTLDAAGKRTAFFNLPAGLGSSIVGLELHHTFVVLSNRFELDFVADPKPVRITR